MIIYRTTGLPVKPSVTDSIEYMVPAVVEGMEGKELVAVRCHVECLSRVAHRYSHRLPGVHVRTLRGRVARRRLKV